MNPAAYTTVYDILNFLINRTRNEYEPRILLNDLEGALSMLAKLVRDVRTMDRGYSEADLQHCLEEMQRRHEWAEFNSYMEGRSAPPPLILWRAHNFDTPYEVIDENTSNLVRNFASDLHKWNEMESASEITVTLPSFHELDFTLGDLANELSSHLKKTQINQQRSDRGKDRLHTNLVSLSGDLRWTMHYTSQKAKAALNHDEVGIAAFDTKALRSMGIEIWRVKDIIEFLESKPGLLPGGLFDKYAKQWAKNADEYVIWDYIGRDCLINFCSWVSLFQQPGIDKEKFLLEQFVDSKNLGYFAKDYGWRPMTLKLEEYVDRAADFAQALLGGDRIITPDTIRITASPLSRPSDWGYRIRDSCQITEDLIMQKIMAEIMKNFVPEDATTPAEDRTVSGAEDHDDIVSNADHHRIPYIIEKAQNLTIDDADSGLER
ncbi:uncharacterized protein BHQ10_002326 [Talaromyces amestolkiae]|uniref:Uncharacterized protein n=1 Tax=Talaromyces amestolkiae TaxID=1196081 RepID=A0A364KRY7_TALAM|nr:uncharacterized protein BHQ10_002326 [Talaromyces amestolkiae]RAO66314.1 hypothetical protein BHQ10_002326 [Talaromyces amestolkiae]